MCVFQMQTWRQPTTGNSNMAEYRKYLYFSMYDEWNIIEIPTAKLGLSTIASSKKVANAKATTIDNRKYELKPEIDTSLKQG